MHADCKTASTEHELDNIDILFFCSLVKYMMYSLCVTEIQMSLCLKKKKSYFIVCLDCFSMSKRIYFFFHRGTHSRLFQPLLTPVPMLFSFTQKMVCSSIVRTQRIMMERFLQWLALVRPPQTTTFGKIQDPTMSLLMMKTALETCMSMFVCLL